MSSEHRGPAVATSAATSAPPPRREFQAAFAVIAVTQATLVAAITVITLGLPAIQRDFGVDQPDVALVTSAYGLSFGGLLLLGGRVVDLLGRRRAFTLGVGVFGGGSAVGALAPSVWVLVVGRFLQGCGAALAAPAALALLRAIVADPARRNRAFAFWGGLGAVGATVGLVLSGAVLTVGSWRWTLAIPAGVAILVVGLAPVLLPPSPRRPTRLDLTGAVLATAGVSALSYGMLRVGEPRGQWLGPAGVALLVAFVVAERRARDPLLPLTFLRPRRHASALLVIHLTAAAMSTLLFLLTLYFRQAHHLAPFATALAFLPYSLVQLAAGAFAGTLVGRFGPRQVTVAGLGVAAIGLLLLSRLDADAVYDGALLAGLVVFALGAGMAFAGATVAAVDDVPDRAVGLAGGVVNTALETGPTVGFAVLVSLASTHTARLIGEGVDPVLAAARGDALAFLAAAGGLLALAAFVVSAPESRHAR